MDYTKEKTGRPPLATIAMVVDNELYGDIRVLNEATVLIKNGFKVKIFCFTFGKYPTYQEKDGIEIYRIRIGLKLKNILFGIVNTIPLYHILWAYQLKKLLKGFEIDAIHAHDLYMAIPAHSIAKWLKIPLVLDLHENYPEAVKNYRWANKFPYKFMAQPHSWAKQEKRLLQMADRIVVLSENFAEQIKSKHPNIQPDSFWIYPNVPDIEELLSYTIKGTELNPEENFNLLYFGGISERRGIYTCIRAIELLLGQLSNIKLVLIGPVDGHEREAFTKAIESDKTKNSIIYIPWIDISELPSYINDCHICLSPIFKNAQHDSGVANKVFQYMLLGKPLIVSNCTPQAQVVAEGECGLVFESDNAQDLARKTLALYSNRELRIRLGENGKQLALKKYNTKRYGQMLVDSYRELLKIGDTPQQTSSV